MSSIRMLDIQALQALVTVVDTGSFSKAAERLHLTQPAVTKRIQQLESQLNVSLFDRFQRKILLTEAGELLVRHARDILERLRSADIAVQNLSGRVGGRLTLAISHHIGLHRLPAVLRAYSRAYPDVELDLRFMESEQAYAAILAGDVEMAFVTLSPLENEPVMSRHVWRDPLVFVVAPEHPLARVPRPTLQELAQYHAILPAQGTHTYRIVEQLFARSRIPLRATMPTNYLETIKMMVSVGLGWSVLPESMLERGLVRMPVQGEPLERSLGAIWHAQRMISNAAQAILAQALAVASQDEVSCPAASDPA